MVRSRSSVSFIGILIALVSWSQSVAQGSLRRVEVALPTVLADSNLTGRLYVAFAKDASEEPRLQVRRYGVPFFGVDVAEWAPETTRVIDSETLGYPIGSMAELPTGRYFVQAILSVYTRFDRSDGHTVWMHMDQWEGQDWRRSPGNLISEVATVDIGEEGVGALSLSLSEKIPPIELADDTPWVKRFKIRSEILSAFWGHPIDIGATVLLPKGYEDHPETKYPVVYQHGHFSLRAPFRFGEDEDFTNAWMAEDFPRVIAVTIQHPTPYFDDSYAVNSANNGPYGDAIHQELIPEIERRIRAIPEPWARVLTGGSTGGWESFALQVLYPDFYGGTWSFSPDPLDFRNVEGINIYEDENAYYKQYEWHRTPTTNTRVHETGAVRLTSKQRNTMELVNGTKGRSGEQLDVWSSVFGPVGDDGYFKPLFDKETGVIDPSVADYWRENYDLRHILERDWDELGPKLVGKLHIGVGRLDDFFLNWGVFYVEEFLESTTDPYYGGSITYGHRGGHQWRPYDAPELIRRMADHMQPSAVDGGQVRWRY